MGKYDLTVKPLADTVYRGGAAYNQGLGPRAYASTEAAGIEGFLQGRKEGASYQKLVNSEQRANDPKVLASEQLRRDLQNQQIRGAISATKARTAQESKRDKLLNIKTASDILGKSLTKKEEKDKAEG